MGRRRGERGREEGEGRVGREGEGGRGGERGREQINYHRLLLTISINKKIT